MPIAFIRTEPLSKVFFLHKFVKLRLTSTFFQVNQLRTKKQFNKEIIIKLFCSTEKKPTNFYVNIITTNYHKISRNFSQKKKLSKKKQIYNLAPKKKKKTNKTKFLFYCSFGSVYCFIKSNLQNEVIIEVLNVEFSMRITKD